GGDAGDNWGGAPARCCRSERQRKWRKAGGVAGGGYTARLRGGGLWSMRCHLAQETWRGDTVDDRGSNGYVLLRHSGADTESAGGGAKHLRVPFVWQAAHGGSEMGWVADAGRCVCGAAGR